MTSGGHVAAARQGQYIDLSQRWGALPPAQFDTEVQSMAKGRCEAIRGTAIHEVGHIIEARNGFQARNELNAASVARRNRNPAERDRCSLARS